MPAEQPEWVLKRRRTVGQRIRDARMRGNLTQETLGEKVGVDRRTIHRWEAGTSDPSLGQLLLTTRVLQMSVTDLFT